MNPLSIELMAESDRKERELRAELESALADNKRLRDALEDLVTRCGGAEGVLEDGSNIDTLGACAALGYFEEFDKGTFVYIRTTNGGETYGTLAEDYRRPDSIILDCERMDGSTYQVVIDWYRIKSVKRED